MPYRSPESKRIPEIKQVCFLENAVASPFPDDHRICIAYPVTKGLQPALIIPPACGSGPVVDTLAIIPSDVVHSQPRNATIYGNCLGLVRHAQRKTIRRIGDNDFVRLWRNASRTEPPFRHVTLEGLTRELLLTSSAVSVASQSPSVALRTAWARSFQCNIPHVQDSASRNQDNLARYWWILDHWAQWEESELDLYARLIAHRRKFPDKEIDDRNYVQSMNTFRKMCCDFLRLKYTGKTDRKAARRRRLELRLNRVTRENHP